MKIIYKKQMNFKAWSNQIRYKKFKKYKKKNNYKMLSQFSIINLRKKIAKITLTTIEILYKNMGLPLSFRIKYNWKNKKL